jgi:hypothetical protein
MGRTRPRPVVLDAGALIALEKRSSRMEALLRLAHREEADIIVPAGALAQAWSGDTVPAPLHRLLKRARTEVVALDRVLAEAAGRLCRGTGTSDVIDASVVLVAWQHAAVIVTSDIDDLRRIDARVLIEPI